MLESGKEREFNNMEPPASQVIRPAATLLMVRDSAHGIEVLALKRSEKMRFLPGFLAFPGGTLEAADTEVANKYTAGRLVNQQHADDPVYGTAAIRECAEELGLVCSVKDRETISVHALRSTEQDSLLQGKAEFRDLLADHGWVIHLSRLRFVGRWVTPKGLGARFDTRFFLYVCKDDVPGFRVHESENEWAAWHTAKSLLVRVNAGSEQAVRPTQAMLRALAEARKTEECWSTLHVSGPTPV